MATTLTDREKTAVAAFDSYAEAEKAVDYLSDKGFPVQHTKIVGIGLRLVEHVLGRLTYAAHALTGGRRDFMSTSQLQADRYEVLVETSHADQARELLKEHRS